MPYFIVKFGWFFILISSNQIWIASNSNNRIKCVENYIHVIYSNCVLTSNLFSRSNRQHNYFVLLFEIFFKLVRWFLWIKYNYAKNTLPCVFILVHGKVLCLSCVFWRRTAKFQKKWSIGFILFVHYKYITL
jgi:hypothetical protein